MINRISRGNNMGRLIAAVLAPAGGFGKFLLVLIALSTSAACAPSIYSFGEYSFIRRCTIGYQLFYVCSPPFCSGASICLYCHLHSNVSE